MRHIRTVLAAGLTAACCAVLLPAPVAGQGTITDGTVSFSYTNVDGSSSSNNFTVGGLDHLFQSWWWLRFSGDTSETALPTPSTQSYVGNVATLTWDDIGTFGEFDATLVVTVVDNGSNSATATLDLTVTHDPPPAAEQGQGIVVQVFNYVDFDLDGTSGDDSAVLISANDHFQVSDPSGTTADFVGVGASAYQVMPYASLRALLDDGAQTDLDNTGLPFGPGDFTGAVQWGLVVPFLGSATVTETMDIVTGAPPPSVLEVPTLSPVGLGALFLLFAAAAIYRLRRQARA